MCDITKKTKIKKITGYKVVYKIGNEYYSCFEGLHIKVGKVGKPDINNIIKYKPFRQFNIRKNEGFYNKDMINKTSMFKFKRDAARLCKNSHRKPHSRTILKITISNNIMQGTTANIDHVLFREHEVTYAGSHIDSFKEVKL